MTRIFAACVFTSICATIFAEDPTTIELGGPRKATATITESWDVYDIKVCLIPVRCFDSGMNRRLSQEKARSYAIEALIRHIGSNKQQLATISNGEVIEAGIVDRRFTVVMRVLRKNVRLTKASQSKTAAKRLNEDVPRSLIKANDDYQETLEVIKKTLTEELPIFNGKLSEFYEAVSDAEELGVTRLTSLHKEIETDRWLLSTERKELLEAVTAQEELFLQRLLKLVEQVENNPKGGK